MVKKETPDLVIQAFDITDFKDDLCSKLNGLPKRITIFHAMSVRFAMLLGIEKLSTLLDMKYIPSIFQKKPILCDDIEDNPFFFLSQPLLQSEPYFKTTWNALITTQKLAKSLGAKYALFILPRYQHYDRNQCLVGDPDGTEGGDIPLSDDYMFEYLNYFARKAKLVDFPIHSLLPNFQKTDVFPTVFDDNLHYNANGHKVAADAITNYLIMDQMIEE